MSTWIVVMIAAIVGGVVGAAIGAVAAALFAPLSLGSALRDDPQREAAADALHTCPEGVEWDARERCYVRKPGAPRQPVGSDLDGHPDHCATWQMGGCPERPRSDPNG